MEPSIDQMKEVIRNGNDRAINLLVLKTDGTFELVDITDTLPSIANLPDVAVRFESFGAGNGYVGPDAAEDFHFTRNTFEQMMRFWDMHKVSGRMNLFAGL